MLAKSAFCMAVLVSSIALVLFDVAPAEAASKPAVKVKSNGKSFTLTMTNPFGGSPVYSVSMATNSKVLSSAPPADWTKQVSTSGGVKSNTVTFKTASKPIAPGKALAFAVRMDDIVYRVSWEALDKTGKPLASGVAHGSLARVIDILMQSDEKMLASLEAMTDYDVGTADRMASQAEDLLFKARAKYKASHALSSGEKAAIEKVLATDGQLAAFLHRIVFVVEKSDEFIEKGQHVKDVEGLLAATKEMELLAYDIQSIAVDMDAFATSYSKVLKDPVAGGIYKMRGYDSSYVGIYRGLAVEYGTIADELLALADSIYQEYDVGQSVSETELQASQPVVDSSLVPPELARFFKGFDSDQDGELAIGEAQAFYSWVEENVAYRYDDEKTTNPEQGYAVGDGRKSTDYRQTPYETYKERAGDCEDTATLEQAFYSYFGVAALIVGVNSVAQSQIDHAATIVLIGGTPEEFREILGDLVYYDIEDGNYNMYGSSVQPGTYMLVDNAYSNGFGYVSGGLEEGAFTISCYIPLENGYGEEWNEVVDQCAIPFD